VRLGLGEALSHASRQAYKYFLGRYDVQGPQIDWQGQRLRFKAVIDESGNSRKGRGEVEAQYKTLVQARYKQAGMRWHSEGLEPLLRVRCSLKDGRYWRLFGHWPNDVSAWQARRKQRRRAAQKASPPSGHR